jgi:hypothetical protein
MNNAAAIGYDILDLHWMVGLSFPKYTVRGSMLTRTTVRTSLYSTALIDVIEEYGENGYGFFFVDST